MVHVLISGKVQGVGFRQYTRWKARKLKVKGWVKNLSDGRVEAMLLGNHKDVEEMIRICRRGPFMAEVANIETEEVPDQEFESFEIIKVGN